MDELSKWNVVSAEVTVSEDDHRKESYKIAGSQREWDDLFSKVDKTSELPKSERIQLIDELAGDCPHVLSENDVSLGMVKPEHVYSVDVKDTGDTPVQIDLTGKELMGKNDFSQKLYIEYRCENCEQKTPHTQHVIEWGVYEYWKKNDDPQGVVDALRLNDDDYEVYFFVGNLRHHPGSYIIISVMRFKKSDMIDAGVRPGDQPGLGSFTSE